MPTAFTYNPSVQVLDFEEVGLLIQMACLICGFCSLGQCFAFGFLQIPPRGGHPCRSANDSPCRVRRRLSLPSKSALPGAPTKRNGQLYAARLFAGDEDIVSCFADRWRAPSFRCRQSIQDRYDPEHKLTPHRLRLRRSLLSLRLCHHRQLHQ